MVGARVEVVDGLRAGTFVLTDDHGHFSLPETFTGAVRIAASKDGYLSQTKTSTLPDTSRSTQPQGWLQFFLELPVPSANVTGAYHVTITADNSCASLPDETRTRTYIAQIAPGETPSGFVATLTGARFFTLVPCPWGRFAPEACTYNRFGIGIAGDYVGGSVGFVEQLSDSTYLIFSTLVEGSVTASGITASLDGSLLYCPDQPRRAEEGLECPAANAVSCTSRNHRLELTRR
jgi:hypothetical protein